MDVVTASKRFNQSLISRQMCKDPQFDLRIIRTDKDPPIARDKGLSDLAAERCAHGDILKVRLRA